MKYCHEIHSALRRSLMTGIASSFNGNTVESIAYSYDALGRPVARNNDAFGYNDRSEVTSASIMGWSPSPSTASYGYDDIGNLQFSSFNAATNAYTANSLNQYTSILCDSVTPREPTYDLDGNMLSDGVLSFTYDAASRLKTVSSNGVTLVTNFYDAKSHRVKKVTPNATTTFFYDDWNLVEERIVYADNTTSTIRYYWGRGRKGKLRFIGQEDIVDEDDVDFSNAYDLTLYREEIIRVVKSMEKSLLEKLSRKVKEARK